MSHSLLRFWMVICFVAPCGVALRAQAQASSTLEQQINVMRFNGDGTPDTSFAAGGQIISSVPGSTNDSATAAVAFANGKVVVAGASVIDSARFMTARYNTNGSLDMSYSSDGFATANFSEGTAEIAWAVADGGFNRVLVAGQATIPNGGIQMAVARFTAEGALDTTFSTNGRLLINFPGNTEVATGIELLAGGKILIVGHAINGATSTFALARLTSSGALDPSFDGDGKMLVVFPGTSYSQASDVAVMGPVETTLPGWYAVVGTAHDTSVEQDRMAVAFFKPDGTLEPTFSGDGMRLVGFSSALAHTGMSVSFDLSSRIVLGGSAVINGKSRLALARMSTTGTLDSTFSADGRSTFEVPDMQGAAIFETVIGNSLITAVGVAIDPSIGNYTVVARFNADGTPAGSFANGAGYLVHDEPFALYDQAVAVTRNGSDKLTVVGWIANP